MSPNMDKSNSKNGCRKFERLISLSLFGEAGQSEIPELREHLLKCSKCRDRFESQKKVLALTSPKIVGGKVLPGGMWNRVERSIEKEATARTYLWVSLGSAAAIIIISLVLAFAFAPDPGKKSPDVAEKTDSPEADSDSQPDKPTPRKINPRKRRRAVTERNKPKQPSDSPGEKTGPDKLLVRQNEEAPSDSPELPKTPEQKPGTGLAVNKRPGSEEPAPQDRDAIDKNKSRVPRLLAVAIESGNLRLTDKNDPGGKKLQGDVEIVPGSRLRSSAGKKAVLTFLLNDTTVTFNTNTELQIDNITDSVVLLSLVEGEVIVEAENAGTPVILRAGNFKVNLNESTAGIEYKKRVRRLKVVCLINKTTLESRDEQKEIIEFQSCRGEKNKLGKHSEADGVRAAKWALKINESLREKLADALKRVNARRKPPEPDCDDKDKKSDNDPPVPPGGTHKPGEQPGGEPKPDPGPGGGGQHGPGGGGHGGGQGDQHGGGGMRGPR